MTVRVVMSDLFHKSQANLSGNIKARILDFIVKLQQNPDSPGLRMKTPQGVTDKRIKVARVNDAYRAVVIELPNSSGYVLAAVRNHDDAYEYAGRLRFGVNEVTGALEVVDAAETMQVLDRAEERDRAAIPTSEDKPLLAAVGAATLTRFGVDRDVADRLVAIADESAFYEAVDTLPRAQGDAVLDLAAGRAPDDVWADLVQREPEELVDTSDVEAALRRPLSRLSFVPFENEEEFRAALEGDLDQWRVWLHPLQRRLAEHEGWNGPFRVTGGAGTGKTVTAIHRARHLARRLDAAVAAGDAPASAKVLVTTFSRNLATTIRNQLVKLGGANILDRVEVLNIDRLASQVLRANGVLGGGERLVSDDEVRKDWETANEPHGHWDTAFLMSEWRDVVLAQGVRTREKYLKISRAGRGRRLSRPQRGELWTIFERFQQILSASDQMTYMQAADRAAELVSGAYRFGVVDEAQDLHPAHWRLLRKVVESGQDDLFIAGDAHQRIYGRPVILSRCGIETRGRSRRLTVNYRTSRQILGWCLAATEGRPVDDLEGKEETLAGSLSVFDGPEPEVHGFPDPAAEDHGVLQQLRTWHNDGIGWSEMALTARNHWSLDTFEQLLKTGDIPSIRTDPHSDESALGDAVRLMTMHRAKGLEYRAIAMVRVDADNIPAMYVRQLDGEERAEALARERNLLYVAASRARERLWVSWSGERSPLAPGRGLDSGERANEETAS